MKLYEITDIYNGVLEAIDNDECTSEEMKEALDIIEADFYDKADNTACIIKDLLSDIEGIKTEQQALMARRKTAENRLEWLKKYLSNEMLASGIKKVETARNKLSFRKSMQVKIGDELKFKEDHPDFCKQKISIDVDKTKVKDSLKLGETIDGACMVECQNLQIK
ncbi:MAG: siphovirus Gp157 family protein [Eubacterium sp.]